MACHLISSILWLLACALHITFVLSQGGCAITHDAGTFEKAHLTMAEEEALGFIALTFTVTPSDAIVSFDCDTETAPGDDDPCYYFELLNNTAIAVKEIIDIESKPFSDYVSEGGLFEFRNSKKLSCTPADGESGQNLTIIFYVLNINEHTPMTPEDVTVFRTSVPELTLGGTELVFNSSLVAEDIDAKETFTCEQLDSSLPFRVACETEDSPVFRRALITLTVADPPPQLDYETTSSYAFDIIVRDKADRYGNVNVGYIPVAVNILDLDDRSPVFDHLAYTAEVAEGFVGIVPISPASIHATDGDTLNAPITYRIDEEIPCSENIEIDPSTGDVSITGPLQFLSSCVLSIMAIEQYNLDRISTVPLNVSVLDINNNCPVFKDTSYSGQIEPGEDYVLQEGSTDERLMLIATDMDEVFTGTFEDDSDRFVVEDLGDGRVYLTALSPDDLIDGEVISLTVTVNDSTGQSPCNKSETDVEVTVTNLSPSFEVENPVGYINENAEEMTFVLQVSAKNAEDTSDGLFYEIQTASGNGLDLFTIDEISGDITVISNDTDAESDVTQYILIVEAQDRRDQSRVRVTSTSVTIIVNDTNDNAPEFSQNYYNITIPEDFTVGAPILTVQAFDLDKSSVITYSLEGDAGPFEINKDSGVIVSTMSLNRDPPDGVKEYVLNVVASDGTFNDAALVEIIILDVNDNPPVFEESSIEMSVNETGDLVQVQMNATDVDDGMNGIVMYIVESPVDNDNITIDETTGVLMIKGPFDREQESEILISVRAEDNGEPPLTSNAMVTVTILDVNDQQPRFVENQCQSTRILENVNVGTSVCSVLAVDDDEPNNSNSFVTYSLEGDNVGLFDIIKNDRNYGQIIVKSNIDRESLQSKLPLQITVKASDSGIPTLSTTLDISINVDDVNDSPPEFDASEYTVFTKDSVSPGELVFSVTPKDADLSPGNIILCKMTSGDDDSFYVNSDGVLCMLYSKTQLDIDPTNPFTLSITAFNPDNGTLVSDKSHADVIIYIGTTFCQITINPDEYSAILVSEDTLGGDVVVQVNATSSCGVDDAGDIFFNITQQFYSSDMETPPTTSSKLLINNMTGSVYAASDKPSVGLHILEIEAYNKSASDPGLTRDTGLVEVIVIPSTNTAPSFDADIYSQTLLVPKERGDLVLDMSDKASDGDAPLYGVGEIVFSEVSETPDGGNGEDLFEITSDGEILLRNPLKLEDIDAGFTVNLTVRVEDRPIEPLSDIAYVLIAITLPYSVPPVFTNSSCQNETVYIMEDIVPGTEICHVQAAGASRITYGLTEETHFNINSESGRVFTSTKFDYDTPIEDRQFASVVYAESAEGLRAYTTIEVSVLDVNDNTPLFEQDSYFFTLLEDTEPVGCMRTIGEVQATDDDTFANNTAIFYTVIGESFDFVINGQTGIISTNACIDRENPQYIDGSVALNVMAENSFSDVKLNDTTTVIITIEDANDNKPAFDPNEYKETLGFLSPYSDLLTVSAYDNDQGENNGAIYYLLAADQPPMVYELFTINRTTGTLSTRNTTSLDQEEYIEIQILVEAWDQGSPPLMDDAIIDVIVAPNFLNEPVFRDENKMQELIFEENLFPSCVSFEPPEFPNGSIPIYSIIKESSKGIFVLNCSSPKPAICLLNSTLDRERQEQYTLAIEATICNDTIQQCQPNECNAALLNDMNVLSLSQTSVEVVDTMQTRNQAVLNIVVNDVNDNMPTITRGNWGGMYAYILGVADDLAYNASVFQVTASDADLDSQLIYTLNLSDASNTERCSLSPDAFGIDNNGGINVKENLYQYLAITNGGVKEERAVCDYVITVTDVATDKKYPDDAADHVMAKIKILYVYEHAIIKIQKPPEQIVIEAESLVSCFTAILGYVIIVGDIRAHLIEETDMNDAQQTTIDPEQTDLWVYAVDNTTGAIVKYWDLKSKWDSSNELALCDSDIQSIRGARPFRYDHSSLAYADMIGFALIIIGGFIALASLLCICVVFESWDSMIFKKGQHLAAEVDSWSTKETDLEGAVNRGYDAESMDDGPIITTTFVTTDPSIEAEAEWIDPLDQTASLTKDKETTIRLFESQELTMDVFYDSADDTDDKDVPPTTSGPTSAHVIVGDENECLPMPEQSTDTDDEPSDVKTKTVASNEENIITPPKVETNEPEKNIDAEIKGPLMSQASDGRFIPIEFPDDDDDDASSIDTITKSYDVTPIPPPSPPPPDMPAEGQSQVIRSLLINQPDGAGQEDVPPPPSDFSNLTGQADLSLPNNRVYDQYF